jgi:hypothetical protein
MTKYLNTVNPSKLNLDPLTPSTPSNLKANPSEILDKSNMKLIDQEMDASCLEFESMKSEVEIDIRGPRFDGVILERPPIGFIEKKLEVCGG